MNSKSFEQARQYALQRLEQELQPHLFYHGLSHTRDEVVPAAERLASMEGINGSSLQLLRTAAWFHDIGFVEQAADHELISARVAGQVLPSFGYTEDEVESIKQIIFATRLPQSPANLPGQVLADADLYVLGGENFMQRNQDLRSELGSLGTEFTDEQWFSGQLKFLEGHQYFTASARSLRDRQKALNAAQVRNTLEQFVTG